MNSPTGTVILLAAARLTAPIAHRHRLLRRALPAIAALGLATLTFAPRAAADTISFKSGTTVASKEVQIKEVDANNELRFTSGQSATIGHRPLDEILTIKATGENILNAAEEAYAAGKFDEAARGYDRVLTSSDKAWAKARATLRLIDAAGKSGQFSLQAKAFIALSGINLNDATKNKPTVPKDKPDQVNAAIEDVRRALTNAALKQEQKSLLITFEFEMLNAVGKSDEASRLLNGAAPPAAVGNPAVAAVGAGASRVTSPAGPTDAASQRIAAERALAIAEQGVQQKNYPAAIQAIESNRSSFIDPAQQVRAVWALAVAKEQTAGNDPAKLQDAAIAYMRVVAHFEEKAEFADNVGGALIKTAEIEERLNKPEEAMAIYDQIAKDSKLQNKWGATATKKMNDLKAKTK